MSDEKPDRWTQLYDFAKSIGYKLDLSTTPLRSMLRFVREICRESDPMLQSEAGDDWSAELN